MELVLTLLFALALIATFLYWRLVYFLRDPERTVPSGRNIVSAADGTVVYVKQVQGDTVPIAIKKKREIKLQEIFALQPPTEPTYLIGIFMHPTSVHVNRAPISGTIEKIIYTQRKNVPMTLMWWRVLLRLRPYERYSDHVVQNERNTVLFRGSTFVFVVQIADIYVNKILCWVKEGDTVEKGSRFGMIKMGSQVDMLFPASAVAEIQVTVGQKVKAGETVIATLT